MARRFLYLNGIATLCVILYHSSAWGFISMFWWTDRYRDVGVPNFDALGGPAYYGLRLIEQLVIFAIPAFLFVSGYFAAVAAGRTRTTIGYDLVWKRIQNLLIPFVLWSLVVLGLSTLAGGRSAITEVTAGFREQPTATVLHYLRVILTGQTTEAFYFVPVLIQLYLLAPLMLPSAKNRPRALLALIGALQLLTAFLRYSEILNLQVPVSIWLRSLTISWLFPGYIFWFGLGSVFGFHGPAIKPALISRRAYLLAGAALTFALGLWEWEALLWASGRDWIGPMETVVDQIYALLVLLLFIAGENFRLPFTAWMSWLGTRSFGVYLVHTIALTYTAKIIYNLAPGILGVQPLFQAILYMVGLGIPLSLMWGLDRSPARRFYAFIFG